MIGSTSMESVLANQPVVIDNGTGIIKAGFAGGNSPRVAFNSCVGRFKYTREMPGGALQGYDFLVGSKAEEHRGALILSYPMEHGVVQNWSDMERIWEHVFNKENLAVSPDEHAILLSEAPLNPNSNREKAAEVFFEGFNVPAMYFALQAILSLFASGRTSGIVLDSGDGVTHSVPVYEGFALPHAITRMDLAGRDVTNHLQLLLRRSGHVFATSSELETVRHIKEKCCYVSLNATREEEDSRVNANIGHNHNASHAHANSFTLPDGTAIQVGPEGFRAAEILFQPDLIGSEYRGVHDCLIQGILKSDLDLRKVLFSQIVLSGGSTLFPGFGDRLLHEVRKHSMSPKDTKIRIAAPPERLYSTWIGGSILASLSTFKHMWITKSQYQEEGPSRLWNSSSSISSFAK